MSDYAAEHFEKLFVLESGHFWFRGRNRIIQSMLKRFVGDKKKVKMMEIGCGTGFVLSGLARFPHFELWGSDLHAEGIACAQKRLPKAHFVQIDFRKTPFKEEFDVVGAFDVLEHIDEDSAVIHNVHTTLKKDGYFVITVPQHRWLWSTQDTTAGHKRRYSRNELTHKLRAEGFSVRYVSSFVTALLPIMLISRLRRKKKAKNHLLPGQEYSYDELNLPRWLNLCLEMGMWIDEFFIRRGLSLPFGGSIIAVAQKS